MSVYPIGFSIHESKIVSNIPIKTKLLAFIEPGNPLTYIYTNEKDYYKDYQDSFFALTTKKAGWDCLRHYEILANGCIPLFIDLDKCPINTMTFLPKDIIMEAMKLYESLSSISDFDSPAAEEYKKRCYHLIDTLLKYTRKHLTNTAMAKYIVSNIVSNIKVKNVNKILFLSSGRYSPDYLRCLTLVGFKDLYKNECHDYPKVPHIYKNYEGAKDLYGKGMTYTNLIPDEYHDNTKDESIIDDIISRKYDIIIYGSLHRGLILWDLVNKYYKPHEIILVCGEDTHSCGYKYCTDNGYDVYVRELYTKNRDPLYLITHVKESIDKAYHNKSNLPKEILSIEGMSGNKTRHLYNNICNLKTGNWIYLEVGTWKGSSFISAMHRNENIFGICVDNWSEFNGPREEFYKNARFYLNNDEKYKVLDKSCWDITAADIEHNSIDIYLYDGAHTYSDQKKAITYFHQFFKKYVIIMVDDWTCDWVDVKKGTMDGISEMNMEILYSCEIPLVNTQNHHQGGDTFWNGCGVFVCKRTDI